MSHYTEQELLLCAIGELPAAETMAIETHATECGSCGAILEDFRQMEGNYPDTVPWAMADEEARPAVAPESVFAAAARIAAECEQARTILAPLSESPIRFANRKVAAEPAMQTLGGVQMLCRLAESLHQRHPAFALKVAEAAVAAATAMKAHSDDWSPAVLAMALQEQAVALSMKGSFREAKRVAARAEKEFEKDPNSNPHDLAAIWLIQAHICVESEQLAEGRILAAAAAKQFRDFGDVSRALNADMLVGTAFLYGGDYRRAVEVLLPIAEGARLSGDVMLFARSGQNVAIAYEKLGDYELAEKYYLEVLVIWDELGFDLEQMRTRWGLAAILVLRGAFEAGIVALRAVLRDFEVVGAVNDGAQVRLMLAEALLATDQCAEVPELIADIVVVFSAERMMRSANLALAYLREAVASGEVTPEVVRHVRTFLENLPLRPDSVFFPIR